MVPNKGFVKWTRPLTIEKEGFKEDTGRPAKALAQRDKSALTGSWGARPSSWSDHRKPAERSLGGVSSALGWGVLGLQLL